MMKTSKINVEYIDHMGDDQRVANVARVSFAKWKDTELDDKDAKLIKFLADHGHWSPFAHSFLTIRMEIPLFLSRQLVKHQVGLSWNEESRRYIDNEPSFYIPDAIHQRPDGSIKQGSAEVCYNSGYFIKIIEQNSERCLAQYNEMLDAGVAPEEARMALPLNTMTNVVWSGSLMAMARIVSQRIDPHAQLAAQEFAKLLQEIVEDKFPVAMKALLKQ